jgi:hypothetical protein
MHIIHKNDIHHKTLVIHPPFILSQAAWMSSTWLSLTNNKQPS